MGSEEPPMFTVDAVMIALDEDDARRWLDQWLLAPRQLRTLMESDIAVAADARDRNEPGRRNELQRFHAIVDRIDT